jgi:hypothetical protein
MTAIFVAAVGAVAGYGAVSFVLKRAGLPPNSKRADLEAARKKVDS